MEPKYITCPLVLPPMIDLSLLLFIQVIILKNAFPVSNRVAHNKEGKGEGFTTGCAIIFLPITITPLFLHHSAKPYHNRQFFVLVCYANQGSGKAHFCRRLVNILSLRDNVKILPQFYVSIKFPYSGCGSCHGNMNG